MCTLTMSGTESMRRGPISASIDVSALRECQTDCMLFSAV